LTGFVKFILGPKLSFDIIFIAGLQEK